MQRHNFFLALLGLIWGSNFLFMKLAVEEMPALDVALWRIIFGALPIIVLAFWWGLLRLRDLRYWPHFLAMALFANAGPYVFFIIGTAHLASGIAGAIAGSVPVITASLASVVIPSERPTRRMLIGLICGLIGILTLSPIGTHMALGASAWLGVGAMFAGSLSYAIALIYARYFVQKLGLKPLSLAAWQMIFALLLLLPFSHPMTICRLVHNPMTLVGLVVGLGLLGTGVAFVIYYELIARMGALRAGTVYYIPPVVALLMGAAFMGEPLGPKEWIGTALILIGVFYASKKTKPG